MRKPKSLYRLPLLAFAAIVASSLFSWASAKSDWDQEANKRKAEYIYLEAQTAYSLDNYDKYVSLIERAYKLDTTDLDIAAEWAMLTLMEDNPDSARLAKSYQLLNRRYYANPTNYYNGVILARIAQQQRRYDDALKVWLTLDSVFPTRTEVSQELARAYLRNYLIGDSTNFYKAMDIYDRIQQGSGRSLELTSERIKAYFLKNDTLAIVNELDSLYAFAPKDSYISQFIGANFDYLNMPDQAIKFYDLACALDSTNGSAYLQRAKFYNAQGDSLAFDREVFTALKSSNLEVESKIDILRSYVAELYTDSTQEQRIRQLFDDLQLMHSGEPEIHSLYGAYLFGREDYTGAAEQFSYAAALNPNDEDSWLSYIQSASLAEDTLKVEDAARGAMEKFPQNLLFPILLSNVYRMNGNNQKALAVLDSVDISDVKNERAVSNFLTSKADIYSLLGDTITALDVYEQAIDLMPDNALALNNAAYFMACNGIDLDKAERYSARSLQNDQLNPTYLDTYAWVFFNKKDYAQAKLYIDIALNAYLNPESTEVDGDTESEAAEEVPVAESEEADSASADVYDHAGDIYFMNGEIDKALEFWNKAHKLDPDNELIAKKVKHKTIFFK